MNNISFGQYYPANSLIHSLDARFKVVFAILYIICSFICKNIISFAALLVSAFLVVLLAGIPIKIVLKSLKPILFILLFTVIINIFFTGGETLLFEFWKIKIYYEGLIKVFLLHRSVLSV